MKNMEDYLFWDNDNSFNAYMRADEEKKREKEIKEKEKLRKLSNDPEKRFATKMLLNFKEEVNNLFDEFQKELIEQSNYIIKKNSNLIRYRAGCRRGTFDDTIKGIEYDTLRCPINMTYDQAIKFYKKYSHIEGLYIWPTNDDGFEGALYQDRKEVGGTYVNRIDKTKKIVYPPHYPEQFIKQYKKVSKKYKENW